MPPKRKLLAVDQLRTEKGLDFSPRHFRRLVAERGFPRPIKPGGAANARPSWFEDEVDAWLAGLAAERDASARKGRGARAHR